MKKYNYISVFILSLLFISCAKTDVNSVSFNGKVLEAPLKCEVEDDSLLSFSSLFAYADTIKLESIDQESMMGTIDNVKFADDLIFVQSNNGLFVFTIKGKFLNKIGKKGRGPGEYLSLDKFDILKSKKEVSILDCTMHRVLVYSYEGDYLRRFEYEDFIHDFAVLPNGHYLFMNPDFYREDKRRGLWELDSNGVFIKQLFTISNDYLHVSINNHYLVHINSEEIGCQGLEDYDLFYHYKNDSLYPVYKYKTDIVVPRKIKKKTGRWTNPDKEYTKTGYYESDRLLVFTATNFMNSVRIIYDKVKDQYYRIYPSYYEKLKYADNFFPFFCSCYEGYYVMSFDAPTIQGSPDLKQLFPDINDNSNPVLFVFIERKG